MAAAQPVALTVAANYTDDTLCHRFIDLHEWVATGGGKWVEQLGWVYVDTVGEVGRAMEVMEVGTTAGCCAYYDAVKKFFFRVAFTASIHQ